VLLFYTEPEAPKGTALQFVVPIQPTKVFVYFEK